MTTAFSRTITLSALAAALMIGSFLPSNAVAQSASAEQQQEQARQDELRIRKDKEQLERVSRLKDRFIVQLEQTTATLAKLAAANDTFTKQRNDLLTSDEGKGLVRDPVSFTAFLQLHQHPSVTAEEIKARQKAAASIVEGLKAEGKQLDVGYLPAAETLQEATELYIWARDRSARLDGEQAALKTMLSKAPKIDDPAKSPTLAKAIEEYQARWFQLLAESKILGDQAAEKESKQIMVDAARVAKLEQAKTEGDRILQEQLTKNAQMKAAYELELLQARKEAEQKQFIAERAYANAQAEIARLTKDAATSRAAEDTVADIQRKKVADEAKKKEQIALLKSDEVQQLLAPFFAKGYSQPGVKNGSYEQQPISLSQLGHVGALKPTPEGLEILMRVAADADKDRPRWPYGRWIGKLTPSQREKVTQAQKYLIDLGDLIVEQGMMTK